MTRPVMGFTLVELMIVMVIISILAAIAIPSYQLYLERARFTEVIHATQMYKTAVAVALQQGIPKKNLTNGKYGIPGVFSATQHVASIQVEKGVITTTGTALIHAVTYILKPNENGTHWQISGSCLKLGLCHEE